MNEQQRKAMELALDYIIATNKSSQFWLVPESNLNKTVTAIKEALAQDALQALHDENKRLGLYGQEPVAWMQKDVLTLTHVIKAVVRREKDETYTEPLYTTPPQRKPLTDEEINVIWDSLIASPNYSREMIVRAIEAVLKEKNDC